jgi:hypothetical protein
MLVEYGEKISKERETFNGHTNLGEADLDSLLAEATTAHHQAVLADNTLDGAALAAVYTEDETKEMQSSLETDEKGDLGDSKEIKADQPNVQNNNPNSFMMKISGELDHQIGKGRKNEKEY